MLTSSVTGVDFCELYSVRYSEYSPAFCGQSRQMLLVAQELATLATFSDSVDGLSNVD